MIFKATNALMHYASKYYDPVKAHEYYMRTRELVGRRSTKGMTDEQKEQWKESQFHIKRDRKFELDAVRNEKNTKVKQFRKTASERREDIAKQLRNKLARITESVKNRRKMVSARKERQADRSALKLIPIPKNASPAMRKALTERNADRRRFSQRVAERNAAASPQNKATSNEQITREANAERETLRADAKKQREEIKTKLDSDVTSTRENWVKKKDEIVQKYLRILDQAFKAAGGKGGNQSNAAPDIPKRSTEERKAIREELRKQRTSKAA